MVDEARPDHPRLRGKRVLLVEDVALNQELATAVLADIAGMQVVVADDGRQALEVLDREEPFDVVLMDCMLPVMDGFEATRAIRANPRLAGLPVIAMTANVGDEYRAQVLAAGMDDYVAKPVEVASLLAVVDRWIGASASIGDDPAVQGSSTVRS